MSIAETRAMQAATTRAYSAIGVTVLLWASAFPCIRAAMTGFGPGELAALRYLVASAAFVIYAAAVRMEFPDRRDLPRLAIAGGLGIAAYNLLLNAGERTVSAGTASFIVNTVPVFAAAFSVALLGERVRLWGWIGMGVSLAGVAIIALAEGDGLHLGSGASLVFGAALCQAAQFVLQKPLAARYGALQITAYLVWAGSVFLLPFAPAAADAAVARASAQALSSAIYLGLFPAAVAYAAWSYALARLPVSSASGFLYLVPPVATAIAALWLEELPPPLALVGGAVAIGGVALLNTLGRRAR